MSNFKARRMKTVNSDSSNTPSACCGVVYFAQDENFKRNVLGRHGWLDRVLIGINDYDGKLYLSRYEDE